MNKSLVFTNCTVGYKKLTCPNTIATIEIPLAISTDKDRFIIIFPLSLNIPLDTVQTCV